MEAYKLFERYYGLPRSLVHGMPYGGFRTRVYSLNTLLYSEPGTPGFCVFPTKEKALEYLPRFRVRADKLILCKVLVEDLMQNPTSSRYNHFGKMTILSDDWHEAVEEHGKK